MGAREIQALAQQFCDAFNKKDLKTALNMLSGDLEVFDHVPYRFDNKEQFVTFCRRVAHRGWMCSAELHPDPTNGSLKCWRRGKHC
jgi:ketosteroid isomerase-like protein